MGSISDYRLRHQEPRSAPGKGHPIAAAAARLNCSATVIRKRDANWYYEDELPILVEPIQYQEVPFRSGELLLWTGMQVQIRHTAANRRWAHRHLVVSLWPYSRNWFAKAAFRPPMHRKKSQILDRLWKELIAERNRRAVLDPTESSRNFVVEQVHSESALPSALEHLKYDPFETNDDWFTARMPDPMRYRWPDIDALGPDFSVARNPNFKTGLKAKQPRWYFGACEDLEKARSEIRLEALAHPHLWELPRRPSGPHSRALDNLEVILDAAVWQALAGRAGNLGVNRRASRVLYRVIHIVRERLENESKTFDRQ